MDPITHARQEQIRCAGEYLDDRNSDTERAGARLGMYDNFAEEFLLTYPEAIR